MPLILEKDRLNLERADGLFLLMKRNNLLKPNQVERARERTNCSA